MTKTPEETTKTYRLALFELSIKLTNVADLYAVHLRDDGRILEASMLTRATNHAWETINQVLAQSSKPNLQEIADGLDLRGQVSER